MESERGKIFITDKNNNKIEVALNRLFNYLRRSQEIQQIVEQGGLRLAEGGLTTRIYAEQLSQIIGDSADNLEKNSTNRKMSMNYWLKKRPANNWNKLKFKS